MKKVLAFLALATLILAACGGEEQTSSQPTEENKEEKPVEQPKEDDAPISAEDAGTVEEGGYIKYRGAEWGGEVNGMKVNVNSVSLTEDLSVAFQHFEEAKDQKAALVWVTVENTTDQPIEANFETAAFVADGHEFEVDQFYSEFTAEEVRPGTKKDGDIIFPLNPDTDVRAIKNVKFYFNVIDPATGEEEEVEAEMQLK